jgi:hypothetical protein
VLISDESAHMGFVNSLPHPFLMTSGQVGEEFRQLLTMPLGISVMEIVRESFISGKELKKGFCDSSYLLNSTQIIIQRPRIFLLLFLFLLLRHASGKIRNRIFLHDNAISEVLEEPQHLPQAINF